MSYPPAKRPRGINYEVTSAAAAAAPVVDPFGDDDAFTQDDLDEIDVIVSQSTPPAANKKVQAIRPPSRDQRQPLAATKANQSRGNGIENAGSPDRQQYFTLFEDQQNELKRKIGASTSNMEPMQEAEKVKHIMKSVHDEISLETKLNKFLKRKISDLENSKRELVGVFGRTGAGKSSLINAIIGEKDLLPSGDTSACTSVMIQVQANMTDSKYIAEIEFIPAKEWEDELWDYLKNPDSAKDEEGDTDDDDIKEKISALYGEDAKNFSDVADYMDNKNFREIPEFRQSQKKTLRCKTSSDLSEKIAKYTRRDIEEDEEETRLKTGTRYWPLVKCVTIKVPNASKLLQHVALIDLPGNGDCNKSRDEMWKRVVGDCSAVWIVSSDTSRVDSAKEPWEILNQTVSLIGNGGECRSISFICTKSDVIDDKYKKSDKEARDYVLQKNKRVKEQVRKKFNKEKGVIKKHFSSDSGFFQVFTVTSKDLNELKYLQADDTEIPQLQQFLKDLNDHQSKTNYYVSGAYGILSLMKAANTPETGSLKVAVCKELETRLQGWSDDVDRTMMKCKDAFEKCLDEGVTLSMESYPSILKGVMKGKVGQHHSSLKYLVQNNGIYKKLKNRRKTEVNLNEKLSKHLRESIDQEFSKTFPNEGRPGPIKEAIDKFTLDTDSLSDEQHKGLKLQMTFLKTEEAKLKKKLANVIREEKKEIYFSLTKSIQESMQPCYDKAKEHRGKGMLENMRQEMQAHLIKSNSMSVKANNSKSMFEKAKERMLYKVESLKDKLLETLQEDMLTSIDQSINANDNSVPDVTVQYEEVKILYDKLKSSGRRSMNKSMKKSTDCPSPKSMNPPINVNAPAPDVSMKKSTDCPSPKSTKSMNPPINVNAPAPDVSSGEFISNVGLLLQCCKCSSKMTDPVSIPCGHSFCKNCINTYWAEPRPTGDYVCPLCKRSYPVRPELSVNEALSSVLGALQQTACSTPTVPALQKHTLAPVSEDTRSSVQECSSGSTRMIKESPSGTALPAMTSRTVTQTAGTTVTSATVSKETMEDVNKCKNYLSTLIKLASSRRQSSETAALVKDLLDSKLEAEEFISRLSQLRNSSPQTYLVPFLKRSLPAIRHLFPDSAAFIQQSQLPQLSSEPASTSSTITTPATTTTVVLSSAGPCLTTPVTRHQLQPASKLGQTAPLRSLPAARQLFPDSAAFIQQSQLPQLSSEPASTSSTITTTITTPATTVILSSAGPCLTTPVTRHQLQPASKLGQTAPLTSSGTALPDMTSRTVTQTAGTTVTSATVSKLSSGPVTPAITTTVVLSTAGPSLTAPVTRLQPPQLQPAISKPGQTAPLLCSGPATSTITTTTTTTSVVLSTAGPSLTAPVTRPQPPQLQPAISKPGQTAPLVFQTQQQGAILRPQVTVATTPIVTLRNQAPGGIMLGQLQPQVLNSGPSALKGTISNLSIPAGMVLMRSESGQLVMVDHQTLAQMQAQAQMRAQAQAQMQAQMLALAQAQQGALAPLPGTRTPTNMPAGQLPRMAVRGDQTSGQLQTPSDNNVVEKDSRIHSMTQEMERLRQEMERLKKEVQASRTEKEREALREKQTSDMHKALSEENPHTIIKAITVTHVGTAMSVKMSAPQKAQAVMTAGQTMAKPGTVKSNLAMNSGTAATVSTPAVRTTLVSQKYKKSHNVWYSPKFFLDTLIKLAQHNCPSPETPKNVIALVQDLLDAKIEPEEFSTRVQAELKSSPQPFLIPFLKKGLPALRQSLLNNQQSLINPTTSPGPIMVPPTAHNTTTARARFPPGPTSGSIRTALTNTATVEPTKSEERQESACKRRKLAGEEVDERFQHDSRELSDHVYTQTQPKEGKHGIRKQPDVAKDQKGPSATKRTHSSLSSPGIQTQQRPAGPTSSTSLLSSGPDTSAVREDLQAVPVIQQKSPVQVLPAITAANSTGASRENCNLPQSPIVKTPTESKSRRPSLAASRVPSPTSTSAAVDDFEELMNEFTDDYLEDDMDPAMGEDELLQELSDMINS